MINPYRDEAIDSLQMKSPICIGRYGSDPLWIWCSRAYLPGGLFLQERYLNAYLPAIAFDLLTGYVTSRETHRGYTSKEAALEDLIKVRKELE